MLSIHASKFQRNRWSHTGFTLIELLIVVAVIGILASIVGANYFDAMQRAEKAACQQNLRSIHTALMSYRLDYGKFPLADGTADTVSRPDATGWACGPAANGYWSGISLLLAEKGYCSPESLYCPALKRTHAQAIDAFPTCSGTNLAGKSVPQWRFLRYAYNYAAQDAGGASGGSHDVEKEWGPDVWMVRCLHLDIGQFDPQRAVRFPFRLENEKDNDNSIWYGEFEMNVHGQIRPRPVQPMRRSR